MLELIFRHASAHGSRRADAASHHLQQVVRVLGTGPLLVLDDLDSSFHLGLLDQLAIRPHALLRVGFAERVRHQSRLVQTSERDELPAVTQRRKTLDVRLLLVLGHGRLPVERRRQVVRELLLRPDGVHAVGELLGLCVVRKLRFHPDEVGEGCIGNSSVNGTGTSALVSVVTLAGSRCVPIKVDVYTRDALCNGPGFGVALALARF